MLEHFWTPPARFLSHLYWDLQHFTLQQYYARVTRASLYARLRWYLLDGDYNPFIPELRRAVWGPSNTLRRVFDEFAVDDAESAGRKGWTQESFSAFLATRLSGLTSDFSDPLACALWRMFSFSAVYPFADLSALPAQQMVDLEGWTQALALLATDAVRNVSRNRASLAVYGAGRRGQWLRFASLVSDAAARERVLVRGGQVKAEAEADVWDAPSMLDEIARVAVTQLPLSPIYGLPSHAEILERVQRLGGGNPSEKATNTLLPDLALGYRDLLFILAAMLQVRPVGMPGDFAQCIPRLDMHGVRILLLADAKAILQQHGIREAKPVSFDDYLRFSDGFDRSPAAKFDTFDHQFDALWRALFFA